MVRLSNVGFKYDKYVFAHISYTFERGRLYILQGENGVGKTTLVRVILGLLTPSEGSVERGRPCVMSYLPDTNGIYGELTVMQNISSSAFTASTPRACAVKLTDGWMISGSPTLGTSVRTSYRSARGRRQP